ncbi:hypothetical protein [Gryllotalpicola protaetiae]|uniref:hypothetical protein n=1 Tax=Gryllotalpicola protaetiae TaxID=2419771 RepID=UPI0013C48537|nr:hypothetical protein [Gryllotalpicola protaetiae]
MSVVSRTIVPMKLCGRCRLQKPVAEFNRSSRSHDGLQGYCRDCQKAHYRGNAVRHRANVRRTEKARLQRARAIVYEAIKAGCVDCGFRDIRALQFDHVRGEKIGDISRMIQRGVGFPMLRAEIAKCEVRCANCHSIATAERRANDWHRDYL